MQVKIGNKIYSDSEEPIMLIFTPKDKENIRNMNPECYRFACIPVSSKMSEEQIDKWMEIEVKQVIKE